MSHENVELVRSGAEALARGDLDKIRQFLDPAFEFDVTRTDLNPRVYHGLEGLLELMSEWTSTWDDYEFEVADLVEAGEDRVVGVLRERGRMKDSDSWVEHERGVVWTLRADKVLRYDEYPTKGDALEAAGLRE
jgi:ketosteroid isomerase-like protein